MDLDSDSEGRTVETEAEEPIHSFAEALTFSPSSMSPPQVMSPSLQLHLPDFAQSRVLVVGEPILDRYCHGQANRISEEAPTPALTISRVEDRLGGAANVAYNVAALHPQAQVELVAFAGYDEAATVIKRLASELAPNMMLSFVRVEGYTTVTKVRAMANSPTLGGGAQQLLRLDYENTAEFLEELDPEPLLATVRERLERSSSDKPNVLILSDYGRGSIRGAQELIQLAHAHELMVVVDPKGTDMERYRGANIVKPNYEEFCQIAGVSLTVEGEIELSEEEIGRHGQELMSAFEWEAMLVTRAEKGMLLLTNDRVASAREESPDSQGELGSVLLEAMAVATEVVDVNGAGDTVIAALAASLSSGSALNESCQVANAAAAVAVGKRGTATASLEEIERILQAKSALVLATGNGQKGHTNGKEVRTPGAAIVSRDQLAKLVRQAKEQGERIVFTCGCFDLLHMGHVYSLEEASQYGDRLVVAVNSDSSVHTLKGSSRPINLLETRLQMVAALRCVDWVVSFDELSSESLIRELQPDVFVKGGDYASADEVVEARVVQEYGGEVKLTRFLCGYSSTSIINGLRHTKP